MSDQRMHPEWTARKLLATKGAGCAGCPSQCSTPKIKGKRLGSKVDVLVVISNPQPNETSAMESAGGQFVRRCLEWAKIDQQCGVTHALKCAPIKVEKRKKKLVARIDDPNSDAVEQCAQYLANEVAKLQPKVVVTCGSAATEMVLGSKRQRGQLYVSPWGPHVKVFPILNPAACIITGSKLDFDTVMSDLRRLRYYLDNGRFPVRKVARTVFVCPPQLDIEEYRELCALPEHNGNWPAHWRDVEIIDWQSAMATLVGHDDIVLDIETVGIDPYDAEAEVTSLAWSTSRDVGYVMPVWHKDFRDESRDRLEWYRPLYEALNVSVANAKRVVFHNSSFDSRYLDVMHRTLFGTPWVPARPFHDTLLMHSVLEPTSYHGMDPILSSWGYESHKGWFKAHVAEKRKEVSERLVRARELKDDLAIEQAAAGVDYAKKNPYDLADWWILSRYNAIDTGLTFEMLERFWAEMCEKRPHLVELYNNLKVREQVLASKLERNGLAFDREQNERLEELQLQRIDESAARVFHNPAVLRLLIEEYGYPVDGQHGLDPTSMLEEFNLGSGQQVSRLFFGYHVKTIDGVKTEIEEASLGVSREGVDKKRQQMSTSKDVLARVIGTDWKMVRARHPWSTRREVEEDGEVKVEYDLTGHELHSAYVRGLDMGYDAERMSKKLLPVAARTVAEDVGEYRNAVKFLGTYVRGYRDLVKPDGLIRDYFKVSGTMTGRWSSFLHTTPRDKPLKRQIVSRFGSHGVIMGADQGQIEARIAGSLSNDPKLIAIFDHPDADFHRSMAARFYRIAEDQVTKDQRQISKALSFAVLYGRIVESLAEALITIGFSASEAMSVAEEFEHMFWSEFAQVAVWRDQMINDMNQHGVAIASTVLRRLKIQRIEQVPRRPLVGSILIPQGAEVLIPTNASDSEKRRLATNYPTQGTGGLLMHDCAIRIVDALEEGGFEAVPILEIHDALYLDVPRHEVKEVAAIVHDEMTDPTPFLPWLRTSLTTDIEVGDTYGDMSKMEPEEYGR